MTDAPDKTRADVEVIEKTTGYQGYARMDVYRLRHRLHEGGWSAVMRREILERGHAVAVLLYDADLDALVLLEQFRPGAYAALDSPWWPETASPWLVEVIAGIVEEGETALDVARREAMEEAGCEVRDMEFICRYLATPGICSETVLLYCGQVDASGAGGIHGLDHEQEDIRVMVVPAAQAMAWLDQGRITNSTCLIALQWFRFHHQRLREIWRGA